MMLLFVDPGENLKGALLQMLEMIGPAKCSSQGRRCLTTRTLPEGGLKLATSLSVSPNKSVSGMPVTLV